MSATASARPRGRKKISTDLAVAMVIDASSSMAGLSQAVIDGFNEYVDGLREQEGNTFLSLTVFSDSHEFVYEGVTLDKVPPLTGETYRAYGNTALYDSIAATVERVTEKLGAKAKDSKVLIVTITDGEENRSTEHTAESLAALVRRYESKGNYTFVYLGLGQSREYVSSAAVAGIGYVGDNGYFPEATQAGLRTSFASLAKGSSVLRSSPVMSSVNLMADAGIDMESVATPDGNAGSGSTTTKVESSLLDHLTGGS